MVTSRRSRSMASRGRFFLTGAVIVCAFKHPADIEDTARNDPRKSRRPPRIFITSFKGDDVIHKNTGLPVAGSSLGHSRREFPQCHILQGSDTIVYLRYYNRGCVAGDLIHGAFYQEFNPTLSSHADHHLPFHGGRDSDES